MRIRKHTIWQVAKVVLAFSLIAIVIYEVNIESVAVLWNRMSLSWFLLSVFAFCASVWFMACRYSVLLGTHLKFRDLFHLVLYQNITGNLIATAAGAAWYVGALRKEANINIARSIFSLVAARFGDLLSWLVALSLATFVVWRQISMLHFTVSLVIALLTGVAMVGVLMVILRCQVATVARGMFNRFDLPPGAFIGGALETVTVLLNHETQVYKRSIGPFLIYSLLTIGSMLLFAYSSLQIFEVNIGIWPVIFVVALTQIMSFIPVQVFGGLGLYDLTYLYLYGLFGVDRSEFAAVIVGLRICFYLANFALLPLLVITGRSRKEKLLRSNAESL